MILLAVTCIKYLASAVFPSDFSPVSASALPLVPYPSFGS